jgi:hypothetical protein
MPSLANRLSFLVAVVSAGCSSSTTTTSDGGSPGSEGGTPGIDSSANDSAVETSTVDAADGGVPPTLLADSIFGFSTVPPTGPAESNPYGVAVVPTGFPKGGTLQAGDILVSNFNGASGVQGTGSTLVRITPAGVRSTLFTSTQLGFTEALAVLKSGLVIVGNVPNLSTGDGGILDAGLSIGLGSLQVLGPNGQLLQTITDDTLLADPWGLTVNDMGSTAQIFVSNVITGTVTRVDVSIAGTTLTVTDKVQIASGYATRLDAAALVVGPGGMVYDAPSDTLYLASEDEQVGGVEAGTIFSIAKAGKTKTDGGKGTKLFADANHLRGPVGLVRAPDGNLIAANTDAVNSDSTHPSELVEFTTGGKFVDQFSVDPKTGGAFAVAVGTVGGHDVFAAVDDDQAMLTVWETGQPYHPILELSTVPPTGPAESNPYGVAVVPAGFPTTGKLRAGDLLVSNFNGADGVQGTGSTVLRITPSGTISTLFTSTELGLSGALAVLKSGLVVVGNVPNSTPDGGVSEAGAADAGPSIASGTLQILDTNGTLLQTITDAKLLADPWGLAVNDMGSTAQIFASNVMTGTVTRLDVSIAGTKLTVKDKVQIASGYATRTDASALVVGPGGMVYDAPSDTLFLASEDEKVGGVEAGTIFSIAKASTTKSDGGKGTKLFADASHLHGPVGLAQAPNGNLIAANTDAVNADSAHPSELVEFTTAGTFVDQVSVDPTTGAAFGLAIGASNGSTVLAVLSDNQTALSVRSIP